MVFGSFYSSTQFSSCSGYRSRPDENTSESFRNDKLLTLLMFNLTYKSCDIMKKTKDTLTSQLTTVEKTDLVARIATMGVTHIAISVVMDDNARLISVGSTTPSPRTVESETQDWCSIIHGQPNVCGSGTYGGFLKGIHRGAFCGVEKILGLQFGTGKGVGTGARSAAGGKTTGLGGDDVYLDKQAGACGALRA